MRQKQLDCFNFFVGSKKEVTQYLLDSIKQKRSFIVLPTSLNDLASVDADSTLCASYKAVDYCTTDGMPLVWYFFLLHFLQGKYEKIERVYGPTLMREILQLGDSKTKHFFYGSSQETITSLQANILKFAPQTSIAESVSPPFRQLSLQEEGEYIAEIVRKQTDVLWIGLSSPKQVKLAARWKKLLPHTAIFCVGAAFDFLAERQSMAPKTVQHMGLEWLYRLIVDPKRLWKRYLVVIPRYLLRKLLRL